MRAGTTSLYRTLATHPSIYFTPIKEPNFFVKELPESLHKPNYHRNENRYFSETFPQHIHITHVKSLNNYGRLFSLAKKEEVVLMDASTAYLQSPGTANAIHEYNSKAKIIIIKRDPLERAYSHYLMDKGLGRTLSTFENILKKEIEQYESESLPWYSYIGMSSYKKAMHEYSSLFDQVLVLEFEKLISDPDKVLGEVYAFLNLEPNLPQSFENNNSRQEFKFSRLLYWMSKTGLMEPLRLLLPINLKQYIYGKLSKESNPINISQEIKAKLDLIWRVQ